MTDTFYVRELDPNHPGLNPNLLQFVQTNCCPNVNSRTPDAPRKQVWHFTSRKCQPNLRVHTDPDGWYRRRRPPHGVAERPERFRPAPVCKTMPSHRSWYRRSVPSVSRPHLCGTYRHCEEEGLSLLLRSPRYKPAVRGGKPEVQSFSSTEVHSDAAEELAEDARKRAGVQSLFLRCTRGRR